MGCFRFAGIGEQPQRVGADRRGVCRWHLGVLLLIPLRLAGLQISEYRLRGLFVRPRRILRVIGPCVFA
jgi:hypothetical protein